MGNLFGRALTVTAHDHNDSVGVLFCCPAYQLAAFSVALSGYGAGIYNVYVVTVLKGGTDKSVFTKQLCHGLRFVLRDLAAKSIKAYAVQFSILLNATLFCCVNLGFKHAHVRKSTILFRIVKSVSYNELVGNFKSHIIGCEIHLSS